MFLGGSDVTEGPGRLSEEYRFTHFTSNLDYQDSTLGPATSKTTWDSNQIIAGITFRFP